MPPHNYDNVMNFYLALFLVMCVSFAMGVLVFQPSASAKNAALVNARTAFYANESEAIRETSPLIELVIRRQQVRIASQYCVNNEGK